MNPEDYVFLLSSAEEDMNSTEFDLDIKLSLSAAVLYLRVASVQLSLCGFMED